MKHTSYNFKLMNLRPWPGTKNRERENLVSHHKKQTRNKKSGEHRENRKLEGKHGTTTNLQKQRETPPLKARNQICSQPKANQNQGIQDPSHKDTNQSTNNTWDRSQKTTMIEKQTKTIEIKANRMSESTHQSKHLNIPTLILIQDYQEITYQRQEK